MTNLQRDHTSQICNVFTWVEVGTGETQINKTQYLTIQLSTSLSYQTLFLIDSYIKLNYLNYNLDIHGRTKLI